MALRYLRYSIILSWRTKAGKSLLADHDCHCKAREKLIRLHVGRSLAYIHVNVCPPCKLLISVRASVLRDQVPDTCSLVLVDGEREGE